MKVERADFVPPKARRGRQPNPQIVDLVHSHLMSLPKGEVVKVADLLNPAARIVSVKRYLDRVGVDENAFEFSVRGDDLYIKRTI